MLLLTLASEICVDVDTVRLGLEDENWIWSLLAAHSLLLCFNVAVGLLPFLVKGCHSSVVSKETFLIYTLLPWQQ